MQTQAEERTTIAQRETHSVTIEIVYDLHGGDEVPTPEEWEFRLRLGGTDIQSVQVTEASHKIRRRPRAEPRP